MTDQEPEAGEPLQFDRVVTPSTASASAATGALAVECALCHTSIETEYYDVNGSQVCGGCRTALEAVAETPAGLTPLITAAIFGLGAGIVGAAIYYAVIALANLEIGIVAILIGYMVGYAVRKGARGRGGLRFQLLAVALTYFSVALAYTPIVIKQAVEARKAEHAAPAGAGEKHAAASPEGVGAATTKPAGGSFALPLLALLGLIVALPVLVVMGSFPSGLISAIIIFIGMTQAWRMTGAPRLTILGPYRIGTTPA
jgi:hypothetical protein